MRRRQLISRGNARHRARKTTKINMREWLYRSLLEYRHEWSATLLHKGNGGLRARSPVYVNLTMSLLTRSAARCMQPSLGDTWVSEVASGVRHISHFRGNMAYMSAHLLHRTSETEHLYKQSKSEMTSACTPGVLVEELRQCCQERNMKTK